MLFRSTNVGNQPAQYLGVDPIGDHSASPLGFWFNRDAFANPALGTIGNVGTRSVLLPGHYDFDMGLTRSFQLKESQRFEFRWEVFNVANSFRPLFRSPDGLQTVSVDRTNQLFGQLRISDRPRIMQFALKYFF